VIAVADLSDNWGHEQPGEYHRGAGSSIRASWDSEDDPTRVSWDSDDEPTPMSWDPDRRPRAGEALRGLADGIVSAAVGVGQSLAGTHRDQGVQQDSRDDTDGW
jgi:hypothetical protein